MKSLKYIICAMLLVFTLASCSVTKYKAYSPTQTQLNLQMDDLQYLGETEITVEYRQYLGCITQIDKINGNTYKRDEIKLFPIFSSNNMTDDLMPNLQMASYKLLELFPTADYFVVTNQTKEKYQLFLGSQVTAKAKVKAYSLK